MRDGVFEANDDLRGGTRTGARLARRRGRHVYRTPALKVRGKLLARLREDGDTLAVLGVGVDVRDMLIEAAPDVFFVTEHYRDWPSVLARLPNADIAAIEPLLLRRWRAVAPKALRAAMPQR